MKMRNVHRTQPGIASPENKYIKKEKINKFSKLRI
jgi:hypothetical protein